MIIKTYDQGTEEWFADKRGNISGTVLGDLYAKRGGRKIGFYQVIAERIGLDPDEENRMDRGLRLEEEAAALFTEKTGHKLTHVGLCIADFNPAIMNSPDGLVKKGKKYPYAAEFKCLSPARHLQAVIENKVPDEFESQKVQYFIVNEDLEILYFCFYDPRIPSVPFHIIEVHREDVADKIELFKQYQIDTLTEIEKIIEDLTF